MDDFKVKTKEEDDFAFSKGTRSCPKMENCFYHIAKGAMYLIKGFVDFKKKEVGFGPMFNLSGDLRKI